MSKHIDFTEPLSDEDAAYVAQRSWMARDAELAGLGEMVDGVWEPASQQRTDDPEAEEDDLSAEAEDDEEEVDYHELTVKELEAEIAARNEGREDDDQIEPDSGRKDDLIAALEADDEEHAEDEE